MEPIPMKKWMLWCVLCVMLAPATGWAQKSYLGVGINYWKALGDVDADDLDDDGSGWVVSLVQRDATLSIGIEVEHAPNGRLGVSSEAVTSPELVLLTGRNLFVGFGIGIDYFDGGFARKPFYDFRAGYRFEFFSLPIEIFTNYRYADWLDPEVDEIDSDTLIFGLRAYLAF